MAALDQDSPVQLAFKMNTPVTMSSNTITAGPGAGSALTKAIYAVPSDEKGQQSAWGFPVTETNDANERAQWWDYYAAMYDYYTVLGCEYEIRMECPNDTRGHKVACAVQFDTYSTTASSTGNIMPTTKYREVLAYKNIQWYRVQPDVTGSGQSYTVIRGKYKPGQAKHNIINDGDVKTWTATATGGTYTAPNMNEILTLNFYRDGLAFYKNAGSGGNTSCNIEVNLKYIVQFKDLKQRLRYPNTVAGASGGTTITQTNNLS